MATITLVQRVIRDKVNAYQDEYDLWKTDHKLAMAYFDFCDLLSDGLELYKEICRLDENWRLDVYRRTISYDPELAQSIDELFRRIASTVLGIEAKLLPFFDEKFGVGNKDEFLKCCRELRGVVTKDCEFFADDALIKLRDEALDQHEKGETLEHWAT